MDALLFAAGLGTRLRPLTDRIPKALVEVGGVSMLERVATRLIDAGVDRIVVNTHPFPDAVRSLIRARDGFGVEVHVSHEPDLPLETGGGLRNAMPLLRLTEPFFLHNADILTTLDLRAMYAAHRAAAADGAIATLAVNDRETSRYFLFDDLGLCGHEDRRHDRRALARETVGAVVPRAFCGVHVVEPTLPSMLHEDGAFGMVHVYLRLAREGLRIVPWPIGDAVWLDIGSPAQLERARALVAAGAV